MPDSRDVASRNRPDGEDDRTAEEIRQDIAARRESINVAFDRLNARLERTIDWRAQVSDHPFAALGAAATAGFIVSGFFTPRRDPADRLVDALLSGARDLVGQKRSSPGVVGQALKAAATTIILQTFKRYVDEQGLNGHGKTSV